MTCDHTPRPYSFGQLLGGLLFVCWIFPRMTRGGWGL